MKSIRRLKSIPGAAGVDEAGRGPLAGPVVVAAVILPLRFKLAGINDSKQLAPAEREMQAERIKASARFCVVEVGHQEIDELNILWATMAGMERAIAGLDAVPDSIYVDGNRLPPGLAATARAVIGGDGIIACIAAASILAKTHRDATMRNLALQYPEYGFDSHFGYPTPGHLEALRRHGPCPIHRRSFAPVREALQPCLIDVD
jgi:ribonuclease HII